MKKSLFILIFFSVFATAYACYCQESEIEIKIDANDKIENALRDNLQQPEKVLDVIGVKEGMIIGEPGAGRGYFTLKLAKKVGSSGKIYANDINGDDLTILMKRASKTGLKNIETILGHVDDPLFPDGTLDMAIMVWVYAVLSKPVEFLKNLRKDLKEGGTVVMIVAEPEKTGSNSEIRKRENILKNIKKAGYRLSRIETFLEKDSIYIIEPGS